jgi:Type IV secretion system pilin
MKNIAKTLLGILLVALILPLTSMTAFAGDAVAPAGSTLLPDKGELNVSNCEAIMRAVNYTDVKKIKEVIAKKQTADNFLAFDAVLPHVPAEIKYTQILGCAITTGDVKAWMIPFFIRYVLEFIIGLAGLITVGGIVYGGYLYLFAGLSDDKDKGKNAIKNGILGFILVLTSWAIVNIVITLVTL